MTVSRSTSPISTIQPTAAPPPLPAPVLAVSRAPAATPYYQTRARVGE